MSVAVQFAIELYNYLGFKFQATAIARAINTKETKTLAAILRGKNIFRDAGSDIFELKKTRYYTRFTIAEWFAPIIKISEIDCVRMEFAKDKFPKSYENLQMYDYRNTFKNIQSLSFSYADIFIDSWEEAYGDILTSGIKLKSLQKQVNYLLSQNQLLKHRLSIYENI